VFNIVAPREIICIVPASLIVVNRTSGLGWGAHAHQRALDAIAAAGPTALVETAPGDVTAQVRAALTAGTTRVYACGGDGTVASVAGAIMDSPVELAILPFGTTNVVAREIGLSMRPARAARQLLDSRRTTDFRMWRINDELGVLGGGVGWDARVMHVVPLRLKRRFGRVAVATYGLREVVSYDFPRLRVTGEDERGATVTLNGSQLIAANVQRWAGANRGIPGADPTDDLLDVVVNSSRSRVQALAFWSLMALPGGRPLSLPGVQRTRLRRLTVVSESGRPVEAHANGEGSLWTPFAVEPAGLVRVVLP